MERFSREECRNVKYTKQFEICNEWALEGVDEVTLARGATVADIDNDGFVDIIMGYTAGTAVMLRNTWGDGSDDKRFLTVRLDKRAGPAASIGAIVKLHCTTHGSVWERNYHPDAHR